MPEKFLLKGMLFRTIKSIFKIVTPHNRVNRKGAFASLFIINWYKTNETRTSETLGIDFSAHC